MKNDNEMYQSILSRRDDYLKRKKKRILIIKRTIPVLACFFLVIVLGLGFRDRFSELIKFPEQPNIIEEPTNYVTDTTEPTDEIPEITDTSTAASQFVEQTTSYSVPVTHTVSLTETKQTTSVQQHQNQIVTTKDSASGTSENTQASGTITRTTPRTDIQTTPPIVTTVVTVTSFVTETEPITTQTAIPDNGLEEPPVPPEIDGPPPISPANPPAPPISFDTVTSVVDAITHDDVSSYNERDREAYLNMFKRMKDDGFIYQLKDNDFISTNDDPTINLFPYAAYEDIGIGYYATYKGKRYNVTFYYADHNLVDETDGIADYLKKRMNRRSNKKIMIQGKTVSEFITDTGRIYASSFIDSYHYYNIVSSASEDEMTEFLNILSYEQIPL